MKELVKGLTETRTRAASVFYVPTTAQTPSVPNQTGNNASVESTPPKEHGKESKKLCSRLGEASVYLPRS